MPAARGRSECGRELTAAQVEAVHAREIVRTWPMRGTRHWVPAEDARWMCRAARRARRHALATRYAVGLTEADVELAGRLFEEHLGEPMSRPDVTRLCSSGTASTRRISAPTT